MRFTKQAVDALTVPPGKDYALFWDEAVKGFGVKLNAGGSRQWVAQYRAADGKTKRPTIGRVDTTSLDEARKQAKILLAKAQTGSDPQAEKVMAKKQAGITLGSVAEAYLKHAKGKLKPRSYAEVERHLTKDWHKLAAVPLATVRRADVASHLNRISDEGRKVAATRARAALSAMFTWAMGEGIAEANPVVGTNKPAEEKSRERVLSEAELKAIWTACGNDDYGVMVRLLILTAQRRDEVGGMDETELDETAALWTIPGARTKNGRTHEVPLSSLAWEILDAKPRMAGRTLVFGRGQGGFSGWSASKARLDIRIKEAGAEIQDWRLHDLRRTATTMMMDRLKVQPHIAEAILNHMTGHRAGVAGVYNRATYRDDKRDALDRWAAFVRGL